jgi:Mn-dependent DtxR family transcriptional regulator
MASDVANIAHNISVTHAGTRGTLVSLRRRGLVTYLRDLHAWRLTQKGREAVGLGITANMD